MKSIFHQIGNIFLQSFSIVVVRRSAHNPTDMRPPKSAASRMRIAFFFDKFMMNPMRRHPFRRIILNRHRAENGQNIFQPLRSFKTSMCQKPMIPKPNSETADNPIPNQHHQQIFPTKREQSRHSQKVKGRNDEQIFPIYIFTRLLKRGDILHLLLYKTAKL